MLSFTHNKVQTTPDDTIPEALAHAACVSKHILQMTVSPDHDYLNDQQPRVPLIIPPVK